MFESVTIRTEPNPVAMIPGESLDIAITLTNNSQEVEQYEIAIADMNSTWYKLEPLDMLLYPEAPGNEGTVILKISLPLDASPGSYLPSVQVTSNLQPGTAVSTPINLTINPPPLVAPDIKLEPEVLRTNADTARYRVSLKNNQQQPLTVRLVVEQEQRNVRSNFVSRAVRLAPNAAGSTLLEIQPQRRNWIRADRIYKFKVMADDVPVAVFGTLRQSAALPWVRAIITNLGWSLLLTMLPLILAGLLIAFALWPRPTAIATASIFSGPLSCVQNSSNVTVSLTMRGDKSQFIINQLDSTPPAPITFNEILKTIIAQIPGLGSTPPAPTTVSDSTPLPTRTSDNSKIAVEATPITVSDTDHLPGVFASLISVSPDGRYVVYVTARNQLMDDAVLNVYEISTKKSRVVERISSGFWPSRPIFSEDGSKLVYTRKVGTQLELFGLNPQAESPQPRQLTKQPDFLTPDLYYGDNAPGPLCFATDGNQVIVANPNSPTQTQVDFNTGSSSQPFTNLYSQTALEPVTNIRQPAPAPINHGECFVPTYSMNALEWRDQQMKPRNDKIGEAGCPLTAAAMVLNYYKLDTDPNVLNTCLDTKSDPFDWEVVAQTCSNKRVQGGQRNDFSWYSLNEILKKGNPAIVGLLGGQTGVHFVVVTGGYDNIAATYRVNDPFDGSSYKSLGTFLDEGYQLRWLVDYTINGSLACKDRSVKSTEQFSYGFQPIIALDGLMTQYGVLVGFSPEITNPVTIKKYFVGENNRDDSLPPNPTLTIAPTTPVTPLTTATPTPTSPAQNINDPNVNNGDVFSEEGFYKLIFAAEEERNLTTIHFVIDKTPPVLVTDTTIVTNLDQKPDKDGFQVAVTAPVLVGVKATDSLSGIATIQYRIVSGTRARADGKGSVKGLSLNNQVQAGDWLSYNNDASTKPITFDKAGDYEVYFRAIDGAGNVRADDPPLFKFTISQEVADAAKTKGTPTPSATVSVTPTEIPDVPVGSLKLTPGIVTFNSNQDNATLQLNNSSGTPLTWSFQQPLPAETQQYLNVRQLQQTGTIPPNGSSSLLLTLARFNTSDSPLSFPVNILYNKEGTASEVLTILIDPQPAPTITYLTPIQGATLSGKQVNVALNVVATGKAKPNHANLKATFAASLGAAPQAQSIEKAATLSSNWTISWDISPIPPQQNISITGDICWTNDDSQCQPIQGGVFGLSIAPPVVRVELVPNSPNLAPFTQIQATIISGAVDHIIYSFSYKDINGNPVPGELRATPSNLRVKWDTSIIPPQEGISLNAKVCWGPTDDDANCTEPANQFPAPLAIQAPAITITSGLPTAEVPVSLNLSGQVSQLTKTSPNGAGVYITIKNLKTTANPTGTDFRQAASSFSPSSAGEASWSLTNFDTSQWLPQNLTIIPKICWDATGPDTAINCIPVQTPLNGVISPLTATMATPTDFSQPTILSITTTPPGRVKGVNLQLGFQRFGSSAQTTAPLNNGQPLPVANNSTSFNFDSAALGIRPGIKVSFGLQACGPSGCGLINSVSPNVSIPQTKIDAGSLNPSQGSLQGRPLNSKEQISFNISGRNASTLLITPTDALNNPVQSKQPIIIPTPVIDSQQSISWETNFIPPQAGIKLRYSFCYSGLLDNGCNDPADLYNNLYIIPPTITNIYTSDPKTAYDNYKPLSLQVDQAIYTDTNKTKTISLPITVTVSNAAVVSWTIKIKNITGNGPDGPAQIAKANEIVQSKTGQPVLITPTLRTSFGFNPLTDYQIEINIAPGWRSPDGTNVIFYSDTQTDKKNLIILKLIDSTIAMKTFLVNGDFFTLAPISGTPPINQTIMVSNTTTFLGRLGVDGAFVNKAIFSVKYGKNQTNYVPLLNGTTRVSAKMQDNKYWQLDWDHRSFTPQPALDPTGNSLQNISLAWQLCSSDKESDCTPSAASGDILNKLNGLTLGAVKFNGDLVTDTENKDYSFYTSFNSSLAFSFSNVAPAIIRVWVYPKQNSLPPAASVFDQAVTMATRIRPAQNPTPGLVNLDAFWSDISWEKKDCGIPDNITKSQNCTLAKLREEIKGSQTSADVTLGIQYCLAGENNGKLSCSDWAGLDGTGFAGWNSQKSFKMDFVAIWEPYGEKEVYDDYLITCTPSCNTSRSLKLRLIPMRDSLNFTGSNTTVQTFYIYDPDKSYPLSGKPSDMLNMSLTANTFNWSVTWNNLPTFKNENPPTYTHSVLLRAQIIQSGTYPPDPKKTSPIVSIYTGGTAPLSVKPKNTSMVFEWRKQDERS